MDHEHCVLCDACVDEANNVRITFTSATVRPTEVALCGPCGVPVALICTGTVTAIRLEAPEPPAHTVN